MAEAESLELRVRTLERHNRSLRWTVLLTLVLSILGLMWGRIWPRNGVIVARGFVVEDASGRSRGSFALDASGVGLNLQDEIGRWRAGMLVDPAGRPAVFLFDTTAQPVFTLNLQRSGAPFLRLRSPVDEAAIAARLGGEGKQGLVLSRAGDTLDVALPKP